MFIEEYSLHAASEDLHNSTCDDSTDDNECGLTSFRLDDSEETIIKGGRSYKSDYIAIGKVFLLKSFGTLCSNSFFYITTLCLNYSATNLDMQVLGKALFIVSMVQISLLVPFANAMATLVSLAFGS